jgi:nitrogen-specific signal transduction histidine kinase
MAVHCLMPDATRPVRPARRPRSMRSAPGGGSGQPTTHEDPFFRHIVGSLRNGVIAYHRDGTLALMNDEAYRIFSLTRRPGDIGQPFVDVLADRPAVIRVLASAFEMSYLPNRAELRLKDLNRVIGYTLSQVRDAHGVVLGAVMFFKDLTQVEQLEERERLRDRLASLGEMAAGIAHELKNPLAGIEVMAGLLRRQVPDSADAQSLLADIISEAKLANAIVVQMLEFVRPVRLQVEETDVAQVLNQAVTLAETKAPRGGVAVTVTLSDGLPMITGDQHQLCQVFTNLVANAFEALDGKGQISITASSGVTEVDPAFPSPQPPTPVVVVDVADNGPGIPSELADKIFDPFFTTKAQGSGLGLAIVSKIVDAHDGRIDMSSSSAGTRFSVTLPVSNSTGWFK